MLRAVYWIGWLPILAISIPFFLHGGFLLIIFWWLWGQFNIRDGRPNGTEEMNRQYRENLNRQVAALQAPQTPPRTYSASAADLQETAELPTLDPDQTPTRSFQRVPRTTSAYSTPLKPGTRYPSRKPYQPPVDL